MQTIKKAQSIRVLSGSLIPGRRGMAPLAILGAIAVMAAVSFGVYKAIDYFGGGEAKNLAVIDSTGNVVEVNEQGQVVTDSSGIDLRVAAACPDTKQVNFQARVKNIKKTGTAQYLNSTMYLTPNDGSDPTSYTVGNETAGTYATAITPRCDGKTSYSIKGVAINETAFSFEDNIGLFQSDVKTTYKAEKFGRIQAKAYDVLSDTWVYDSSDTSNTDYDVTPITLKSTTDNSTATALAADTWLQWQIWVKTESSAQFGEDELPVYIAIDADTTDYEPVSITLGGVSLEEVKTLDDSVSGLTSIDLSVLSGYEYIFKVPDTTRFTSTNRILGLEAISKAGVNPDVDIKVRPLAKTRYLSQDGVTIKEGIFKDDTGNSEAASDLSQEVTIDIS